MSNLKLIRGLPGGGKSFLANEIAEAFGYAHYEADDFFINSQGEYKYDGNFIGLAHSLCFARTVRSLMIVKESVVVSNTFTQQKEMQKYIDFAKENNIPLDILEPDTWWKFDIDECYKRNSHNVPKEVIAKMKNRWLPTQNIIL